MTATVLIRAMDAPGCEGGCGGMHGILHAPPHSSIFHGRPRFPYSRPRRPGEAHGANIG
jgi:hypothetical protein